MAFILESDLDFTVLIFGRDPFDDIGYALGIYETLIKEFGLSKK